jgi:hypothetical protein
VKRRLSWQHGGVGSRRLELAFALALGICWGIAGGCYGGRASSGVNDDGETDGADDGGSGSDGATPETPDEALDVPPTTAIPRLSRREIDATIEDVFGIAGAAETFLPEDPRTYVNPENGATDEAFDTLSASKDPGTVFVEGLESMAVDVARELSIDTARVAAIAGCEPEGAYDPTCLRSLIENLGLRLWRRPLTDAEIDTLLAAASELGEEGGHDFAVRMVTASLLQSPEFVYKAEIGQDVGDGLRRLDSWELVTRLSFAMWGRAPSPELLEAAASSDIDDETLMTLAVAAADDPRADAQMRTFHQLWLRYDELLVTDPDLAADMLAESEALVDRVLEGGDRWSTLFTAPETYVTPSLAEHYGLSNVPSGADWVAYGDDGRAGLLSHGSFLSLSSTQGSETLPSRRGSMLAQRILCLSIPPPPPDIDVDDGVEVEEGQCKEDAYAAHRDSGSGCAGCHMAIDPLGFGFERYDGLGRYREAEADKPECAIAGQGEVGGEAFSGPRQFAAVVDAQGLAAACGVEKLGRFASRSGQPHDDLSDRLAVAFEESQQDFRALMVALVTDPAFRYRREDAP